MPECSLYCEMRKFQQDNPHLNLRKELAKLHKKNKNLTTEQIFRKFKRKTYMERLAFGVVVLVGIFVTSFLYVTLADIYLEFEKCESEGLTRQQCIKQPENNNYDYYVGS